MLNQPCVWRTDPTCLWCIILSHILLDPSASIVMKTQNSFWLWARASWHFICGVPWVLSWSCTFLERAGLAFVWLGPEALPTWDHFTLKSRLETGGGHRSRLQTHMGLADSFLFFFSLNKFIYFWLCRVFVAACGLSLVMASGSYSSLWCTGFSLRWLLLLPRTGSRHAGFSSCGTQAQ